MFCHGIWADGSCFNKLLPPLQAEGYEVICAQYGLDTNVADVAATIRTFNRVHNRILLVGHSYGGAVITAADTDDRVAGLVYINALGPDETETSQAEQDKFPKTPAFGQIEVADGRVWMLPGGAACFCGDLPEEEQKVVWATAWPPSVELFSSNAPGVAWRTKPSWYIVGKTTRPSTPTWSGPPPSGWAPPPTSSTAATAPCCPNPTTSSTSSAPPQQPSEPAPFLGLLAGRTGRAQNQRDHKEEPVAAEEVLDIPVRRHVLTSGRPFQAVLDGIYDGISQPDIGGAVRHAGGQYLL